MKIHSQIQVCGTGTRFARRAIIYALGTSGFALGLATPVVAQGTGDIAPPSRDELAPPSMRADTGERVTLSVDGQMERRACALDNSDYDDLTIRLSSVRFSGAEQASDVALHQAYSGYLDRDLPVRALCDIRDRAAALLDDAGYLAAVEIPAQNLGGGQAELAVVLGRLVAIRARGDTDGADKILAGYLGKLVGQPVFNVDQAERYLLLANDLPGTNVRLSLRPAAGGQPGDLVGEVAVLRRDYLVDLTLQNYGSRALGRFSGLARGEVYNITGMGDRTSIALYSSLDFEEQQTVQMGHDMKVGSDGLTLAGQLTLGWTKPSAVPGFTIESQTTFATLETRYPLVRKQAASVWGAVGLDYVNQDVEVNGNTLAQDRVRTAYARLNFETLDQDSISRRGGYSPFEPMLRVLGELELRKGLGIFDASADCRADLVACATGGAVPPTRIEQDPTPFLIRARLGAEYRPSPDFTIAVSARGQASAVPLPAFEEFSGGNFSIGRGYDPSSISGDSGVGANIELRYGSLRPDGADKWAVQPYLFTDAAKTWQEDPSANPLVPDTIASVGGGARFVRGSNLIGDFSLAVPLRDNGFTQVRDVRALFSLTARLSPWRSR